MIISLESVSFIFLCISFHFIVMFIALKQSFNVECFMEENYHDLKKQVLICATSYLDIVQAHLSNFD